MNVPGELPLNYIRRNPVSEPNTPVNTQGYFSENTKSIQNYKALLGNLDTFQKYFTTDEPINYEGDINDRVAQRSLNALYKAIESGVAIPSNPTEHTSVLLADYFQQASRHLQDPSSTTFPVRNSINPFSPFRSSNLDVPVFSDEEKAELKPKLLACKDDTGSYDPDTLKALQKEITLKLTQRQEYKENFNAMKNKLTAVFKKDPQRLFEKAAEYPETIRRLVDVLDLPVENDKGWNLVSQAGKAGKPKLANAFEKAGFGPNLHHKAMVDFAKAMTDDAPNADKSKALKELMGVTPQS